jgi:hypothetical protein
MDMLIERISLLAGSIATQSHINSEPILSRVSSTTNSSTLFFLEDNFLGLYFCIQFQMETWFRLIKHDDSLSDDLLRESPVGGFFFDFVYEAVNRQTIKFLIQKNTKNAKSVQVLPSS